MIVAGRPRIRLLKRFVFAFLLVGVAVGAALVLGRGDSKSGPTGARQLPAPDLGAYCRAQLAGSTATRVDSTSNFMCLTSTAASPPIDVDSVCRARFGKDSRRVILADETNALRCVPATRTDLGEVDFAAYCKRRNGARADAALAFDDSRGWRCFVTQNAIFRGLEIDFGRHEVDTACQWTSGVESYAAEIDGSTHGWHCFTAR